VKNGAAEVSTSRNAFMCRL